MSMRGFVLPAEDVEAAIGRGVAVEASGGNLSKFIVVGGTSVDITDASTAEQINQLLAAVGLAEHVRCLTPDEIYAHAEHDRARLEAWRKERQEDRLRREALAEKLRFDEDKRSVELTRKEADALLVALMAEEDGYG